MILRTLICLGIILGFTCAFAQDATEKEYVIYQISGGDSKESVISGIQQGHLPKDLRFLNGTSSAVIVPRSKANIMHGLLSMGIRTDSYATIPAEVISKSGSNTLVVVDLGLPRNGVLGNLQAQLPKSIAYVGSGDGMAIFDVKTAEQLKILNQTLRGYGVESAHRISVPKPQVEKTYGIYEIVGDKSLVTSGVVQKLIPKEARTIGEDFVLVPSSKDKGTLRGLYGMSLQVPRYADIPAYVIDNASEGSKIYAVDIGLARKNNLEYIRESIWREAIAFVGSGERIAFFKVWDESDLKVFNETLKKLGLSKAQEIDVSPSKIESAASCRALFI